MKSVAILAVLGAGVCRAGEIICDAGYGCAGHNVDTMTCNEDENCDITCSDLFACRELDIYGPELSDDNDSNKRLSLTLDCTAKYACYGATLHTNNLDTIKVTCSDFWSCAYMTIEGQTANQVFVYVPEDGYYSFGSATVYCPYSSDANDASDASELSDVSDVSEDSSLKCSVECGGDRSCYHTKFHNDMGMIDSSLSVGCTGALACNYASLKCSYDADADEWSNECEFACDDETCACDEADYCMVVEEDVVEQVTEDEDADEES